METVATEIAEMIAETAVSAATEVIEVVEVIDYTPLLSEIGVDAALMADFLQLIAGIMVFFVVVILCYFVYKFFRIFF